MMTKGLAKVLLVVGGMLFFFGDSALRRIWGVATVPAEVIGIGGGFFLMTLGAILQFAVKLETEREKDAGGRKADQAGRGSETR